MVGRTFFVTGRMAQEKVLAEYWFAMRCGCCDVSATRVTDVEGSRTAKT